MVWDNPATISVISVIIIQSVALIVFLVRAHDTATAAKNRADEAHEALDEHKRDTDARSNITSASIALIREQFVRKEDLQHLEASIARQFEALQKRLDIYFMNKGE